MQPEYLNITHFYLFLKTLRELSHINGGTDRKRTFK